MVYTSLLFIYILFVYFTYHLFILFVCLIGEVKNSSRLLVCKFVDTKSLICLQNIDLVQPETVVNSFILLKEKFKCLIMTKEDINNSINNKENSTIPKLENCKKGKDDEEIMLLNAREVRRI